MSKASKTRASLKRASLKRSRKAAMKAQYEAWAAAGTNSKRSRSRAKHKVHMNGNHPNGPCGNIGCAKCNPGMNDPRLASPESCLFVLRWRSPKWRQAA